MIQEMRLLSAVSQFTSLGDVRVRSASYSSGMPLLTRLALASALSIPAPYEVQETQPFNGKTVILAAYVSPDSVGHSLLIMRDRAGKTLWKHYLGWKYHLESSNKNVTVRTLQPDHMTFVQVFDAQTGKKLSESKFVEVTPTSP